MDEQTVAWLGSLPKNDYAFVPFPDASFQDTYDRLKAQGWIRENLLGEVRITPAGIAALMEFDRAKEDIPHKGPYDAPEKNAGTCQSLKKHLLEILIAVVAGLLVLIIWSLISH